MGLKEVLFSIFLIIAIIIPLFFKQKEISIIHKINLPNIEITNGSFQKFTTKLEENGTFSKLDYISNNNYSAYNLITNIIDKNYILKTKKMHFENVYNFYNIKYITDNFTYQAKNAIYNPKTKVATAEYFTFFNKKIDGKGKNMVYKNDIITANDIDYIIKGLK